jgi:hypothetical protein
VSDRFGYSTLVAAVEPHLPGSGLLHFEPIPTGKFNTAFWVVAGEDESILRIAPPDDSEFVFYERAMMRQEPDLHALLRAKTTIPVASVIALTTVGQ